MEVTVNTKKKHEKHKVRIPYTIYANLKKQKQSLEAVIKKCGATYEGTDPVEQGIKAYLDNHRKLNKKHTLQETVYLENIADQKDPYDVFGFGILAYFSTLRALIVAFAFCTAAFIPVMARYGEGGGLTGMIGVSFMNAYTLGNLGQTES